MQKQRATFVLVDSALNRPEVCNEIDAIDASLGGEGHAEALAISFFASANPPDDVQAVAESDFLGQAIVVNYGPGDNDAFSHSYVFEAVIACPMLRVRQESSAPLLNRFFPQRPRLNCTVRGRNFEVKGVYYCQQNQVTHACAHACLRMALNTLGTETRVTNSWIDSVLSISPSLKGLTIDQIGNAIESSGKIKADISDCDKISSQDYLSVLASVVESGDIALLVFTTGKHKEEHVVTVLGYTHEIDEWHPLGLPVYASHRSEFYPSSAWIDHFLIHDDGLGPYYSLSSRAFELNKRVEAHWIVALRPVRPVLKAHHVEGVASIGLKTMIKDLRAAPQCQWLDLMQMPRRYVLRPILLSRNSYFEHLLASEGYDGSRAAAGKLMEYGFLPEQLWMVEYTLPELFGDQSKLGEVLVDPFAQVDPHDLNMLAGLRAPGVLLLKSSADHQLIELSYGITSPISNYRLSAHEAEW